ncbi:histidinol-phosphate transaminase [Sneathiella chinensis]|uniref:Histidinol-phosphate aminotransferase n=1 Tax=Sneathiella chinensis TaxID=349750 RepID=A0ABQ5U4A2_9PROT|nr:histidinol-phosphate transaminase [Sneathiella chinensis]GLQ05306.1 histidinol-phosphate aminotransferase [Sneathiella chinensis]
MSTLTPTPKPGILDITPYVGGKSSVEGATKVAKLSSNETPLGASPKARAAIRDLGDSLQFYPDGGSRALAEAIAEVHGLDASRLVCGNGSDEILSLIASAYAGEGDEVLFSEHGFLVYELAALANGAVPVKAPETDLTTDVDALLAAVTDKTKILYLANPNNPTGTYIPFSEIERLHAGLRGDIVLVLDAAYAEYVRAEDYAAGESLVERSSNVIMTRTFSKIYGLAALRIGWGYGSPEIIDVLHRIRGPFNTNALAQIAGIEAVRDQEFVEQARQHNDKWIPILTQSLRGMGLKVPSSVGNFVLMDFAETGKSASDAEQFLNKRGLILRSVASYGLDSCLRMSVGTDDENRAVIDSLREFLES